MMYTIEADSNELYLSDHPDGGKVAYLYHHMPHAQDQIDHADTPGGLRIQEIENLERWLKSLRKNGITHLYEALAGESKSGEVISNLHNVEFRLAFLQQQLE